MNQYFANTFSKMVAAFEVKTAYRNEHLAADIGNYPKQLYKYKAGNDEHDYEMIEEAYLWASLPTGFDDPTDSFVNINLEPGDKDKVVDLLLDNHHAALSHAIVSGKISENTFPQLTQAQLISYKKAISTQNQRYSVTKNRSYIHKLQDRRIAKVEKQIHSPEFKKAMAEKIQDALENMSQVFRKQTKICCLTTRKDNQKLWEDFAAKYSGFVIEYDPKKCLGNSEAETALSNMFQVAYRRHLPTVSLFSIIEFSFLKTVCGLSPDATELMENIYRQLFYKKKEYAGEEEWRIISFQNKIEFPAISAVYMGCNIAPANEKLLKEICFEREIPLYKQRFAKYSTRMFFDPIRKEEA